MAAGLFSPGGMGKYVSKYINYSLVSKNWFDVSLSILSDYKFVFKKLLYRGRCPLQREQDWCPRQGEWQSSWDLMKGIFRLLGYIQGMSLTETLLALGQKVDSVEV